MKCPNCGAEVNGKVCEYCGSKIKVSKMPACPECGSQNVKFDREYQYGNRIPIAVCKDCGYSWDLRNYVTPEIQYKFLILFFGFIFCAPAAISYLIWKAESIPQKAKYAIIAAIWIFCILIFVGPQLAFWFI